MNEKLHSFFEIAMHGHMTEKQVETVIIMVADLYEYYHGYLLTNETILSVLTLETCHNDTMRTLNYEDTLFVFDLFFLVIDHRVNTLVNRLTSDVFAEIEDPLVRIASGIRASTFLRECYYLLLMGCRFHTEFDRIDSFFRYMNYAKGHMSSLFFKDFADNTTVIIEAVNDFIKKYPLIDSFVPSNNQSCFEVIDSHLSINVSLQALFFTHEMIHQEILIKKVRVNQAEKYLTMITLLVLFASIIVAAFAVVYKCKLELVDDLKYCDNLLEKEINYEHEFFKDTLSDVIPRQLFSSLDFDFDFKEKKSYREPDYENLSDEVFHRESSTTNISNNRWYGANYGHSTPADIRMRHSRRERCSSSKHVHRRIDDITVDDPYYQEVTVMMIDIANFNRLLNYLSANEVVNVVTYMTRLIDDRASYYDVFIASKGTTSYTVISGFTEEQRCYHASHIANMALDVSVSCGDLEIDSVPDCKLRLRIGIHTDSSCASIVTHPKTRFRIYGGILKTVQTLQKSSFPNKIQISDNTYKLLSRDRVYNTQKRGYIDLKNGKKICTHWLLGKRVSVVSVAPELNYRRRSTIVHPIELEQKPLYEFDAEEGMPPAWTHAHLFQPDDPTMPHCSFQSLSDLSSSRRYRTQGNVLFEETVI
ncbi:uncharacterized protein [Mytilus edulis]|uniref:uncharacterized protein n=1 Tax=Mytilus edulis TaxID=6550 RepID=UPI0039F09EA1